MTYDATKLREIYEAATPGRWEALDLDGDGTRWTVEVANALALVAQTGPGLRRDADARLIAAMHDAIPELLADIDRVSEEALNEYAARAELERLLSFERARAEKAEAERDRAIADRDAALQRQVASDVARDAAERHLGNLLAVIHRDGGEHLAAVGAEQAVRDAHERRLHGGAPHTEARAPQGRRPERVARRSPSPRVPWRCHVKTEQIYYAATAINLAREHISDVSYRALVELFQHAAITSHADLESERDDLRKQCEQWRATCDADRAQLDALAKSARDLDAKLPLLLRRLREAESERDLARQWGAELLVERDMLASSLEGRGSTFDLAAWFDAKARWSAETFGPENGPQRYEAVVAHIRKELVEVERDPTDLEEWCDVAMLAMDGAWRSAGADGAAFVAMLEEKHAINIVRVWRRGADGTIEHVREEVAVLEDDGDPA